MSDILLDCGTNFCQGLQTQINNLEIDKDWKIHCFEANPYTYAHTKNIINKNFNHLDITLHNKAVWVRNCVRKMTVEYNDQDCLQHIATNNGFSLTDLNLNKEDAFWVGGASNIMEENFLPTESVGQVKEQTVDVGCIDLSEFINTTFSKDDVIYIKMDIEGAEYSVLNKLIKTGAIDNVRKITIEWHNHLLKEQYDQQYLEKEIEKRGIELIPWH